MRFIITEFFQDQIDMLKKKYPKISEDFSSFKNNFSIDSGVDLGGGVRKYREKNSSVPVGKR